MCAACVLCVRSCVRVSNMCVLMNASSDLRVCDHSGEGQLPRWWATTMKLKRCMELVKAEENSNDFRYHSIGRIRPDSAFYRNISERVRDLIKKAESPIFPTGRIRCGPKRCMNDHMAFLPRDMAEVYMDQVDAYEDCNGPLNGPAKFDTRIWDSFEDKGPLEEYIPYTLVRADGAACVRAGIMSVVEPVFNQTVCERCNAFFNQEQGGARCSIRWHALE